MELVRKIEFLAATLDPKNEIFVADLASFTIFNQIYSFYKAKIASLKVNDTPTIMFLKYFNFVDVFSLELAAKLLKYTRINNYAINFVDGK